MLILYHYGIKNSSGASLNDTFFLISAHSGVALLWSWLFEGLMTHRLLIIWRRSSNQIDLKEHRRATVHHELKSIE